MSLLGLDVGTTGCKASTFSESGRPLGEAYCEYPVLRPQPGWAELDSRAVWAAVRGVIARSAAAAAAAGDPVSALAVSALGEAAAPVTLGREILGDSILGSDTRGGEYVAKLIEALGADELFRINPNIPAPHYTLPKLSWLRDNRPELYARAERFLLWGGLPEFLLGADPFITPSQASRTLLFDIARGDWSDRLLDLAGLDRAKLPPVVASGRVVGTVSRSACEELGLPRGARIVSGAHDQCCNALGAGIVRPGRAVVGIGTVECITPVYGRMPDIGRMRAIGMNVEDHVLAGQYVSFVFNQAGSLVRWFRDTFAASERDRPDVYDRLAAEMPAGPSGLLVLPYFDPTGSPRFISDATGLIAGLRTGTTRGEILKGIMEGVTYYFRESLGELRGLGIDLSELVATGGGAKSDAWLQIKADILDIPLVRPECTECGTAGAAMVAGMATGVFASAGEAAGRFVRVERVFTPDRRRHEAYAERFELYAGLYPSISRTLKALGGFPA